MMTSSTATTDEELRLSALHHATMTAPSGSTADHILESAQAYLAFLQGRTANTEDAAADPQVANTVQVHFTPEDTDREPGEAGRRKRLIRAIVRDLRRIGQLGAADRIEAVYGQVR